MLVNEINSMIIGAVEMVYVKELRKIFSKFDLWKRY